MHPKRLESRILKAMNKAVADYHLIQPGDRILVALSGGKDSYGLLWGLQKMRAAAPFDFDLVAYHLDQGQPNHDTTPIEGFMKASGLPYEIEYQDTYTRVLELTEPGKIYCSVCSRFRRAILYRAATRHGCNKVAVGHHMDDLIETLLLNIFYSGQIKSMPPRLLSQAGTHELIRPLVYVPESEMAELSQLHQFPVVPCNLCGSQQAQRAWVKQLLGELAERSHHIKGNILNSLSNVQISHLMDKRLHPLFAEGAGSPGVELEVDDEDDGGDCAPAPATTGGRLAILPS